MFKPGLQLKTSVNWTFWNDQINNIVPSMKYCKMWLLFNAVEAELCLASILDLPFPLYSSSSFPPSSFLWMMTSLHINSSPSCMASSYFKFTFVRKKINIILYQYLFFNWFKNRVLNNIECALSLKKIAY